MHYTIIWVETFTQPLTHKMVQFVPAYLQLPHIPLRDALTGIKSASASSVSVASASADAFGLLDSSRANCAVTEPNLSNVMSSICDILT